MYSATGEDMVWFFNAYMYFEKGDMHVILFMRIVMNILTYFASLWSIYKRY